ncbi:MAG: sialate O-acetylesterase [Chitinivibrionales bacterium]|nr:sialate O-acetylesterase [Chitinivibrionales bacterium]
MKRIFILYGFFSVLAAISGFSQTVNFSAKPVDLQFYGRDAQDSGVITIAGTVTSAGVASISATIYKSNVEYKTVSQNLTYSGGSAPFNLTPKIHAELASYKIEIKSGSTVLATADSVLCGDAFLIDGQSNAVFLDQPDTCRWIRNLYYGTWQHRGSSPGGIGRKIADKYHIPTFYHNIGVPGSWLSMFTKGDSNVASIYGICLGTFRQAGLVNGLKGILWLQGEANGTDSLGASIVYDTTFTKLCNDWKFDYPNLKKVYIFQTHPGSGNSGAYQGLLRNTQRKFQTKIPFVTTISTTGIIAHENPHYGAAGYNQMGDWLYPLIGRDLCGATDTFDINSPNIIAAKFDNDAHTSLTLQFDVPVLWPPDSTFSTYNLGLLSMKDYFYFGDDKTGKVVASGSADTAHHTVTLILKQSATDTTISYTPNAEYPTIGSPYEGPCLFSPRGVGALTFYKFPIGQSLITTSARPPAQNFAVNNALAYKINKDVLSITVGFTTPYRLEIVKPNGAMAMQFSGMSGMTFQINKNRLPAGLYLLRAADAAGHKAAKLLTWY